ncbi:uncharacterized protein LOC129572338 [Sitodiplosis mosellana]|uniref:uncharacterized protein LOC129572338 n=1 Tax=Sitodiplosis mosellana TaxID=263140 RepID=UPI0024442363|nr:uncharacterized protein LOC129572338 [Sitodiplosis mosellana]
MEKITNEWSNLENFVRHNVPMFLKLLLWQCGYDCMLSVKQITNETLDKLEKYIEKNKNKILCKVIADLDELKYCDDSLSAYKDQDVFEFLPGHRIILLGLRDNIEYMQSHALNDGLKGFDKLMTNAGTNVVHEHTGEYSVILTELLKTAKNNSNKSKHAYQYNDIVRYFSTYIFLLCGRTCYETLSKNLPIPSTKTILRCIKDTKECIIEGQLRCNDLAKYLHEHNAGNDVWICEDGSGLVPKILYDPSSDHLIGMTLLIDDRTGCPQRFKVTTQDEEMIKSFCRMTKSSHIYLILAIPLKEGVAPFVLQMFGTDNRFTARNVVKRWNYTVAELNRFGIKVRGFSSDGDPRLLAAMRNQMCLDGGICFMQDATHGILKLRTCFLRSYAALPMGNKLASVAHLKLLIRNAPKEVHGLVLSDVSPIDRQNFKSFEKCMNIRTRRALQEYIPDSEATSFFLDLCLKVSTSLMDYDITPYERIEMLFHAIFFLRIWRKWIIQSKYILRENFITSNAYLCTELNGANLLKLIRIFRDENKPELFLTTMFDSQACERAFRQLRSMGTPNFTKINFTLLELLHMVRRIEVQNEIVYSKLSGLDIKLPKLEKKHQTTKIYNLPNEEEIEECLKRAKRFAINDADRFEMQINPDEIDECEINILSGLRGDEETSDSYNSDDENESEIDIDDADDFTENINDVPENDETPFLEEEEDHQRAFISTTDHLGRKQLLRKSTLVWTLSEGTKKISSDRLIRVQEKSKPGVSTDSSPPSTVYISKQIKLGDWCFFNMKRDGNEMVHIGLVHAFRFANRKLVKDRIYKFDSVNLDDYNRPNLEILSSWYLINDKGSLIPASVEFISLHKYIATVPSPSVDPDTRTLFFDQIDFKAMESATLEIVNANQN